ncbi:MAG: hypothetical protein RL662_1940 [Bacteroidota bacterium]|jgi:pimeloyl-ACP methyl ester carboxylesterase
MPIIQVNNVGVNVLEMNRGASQTIVMIHGMFTNMSVFYFNIAPELAKKYHVVLYDLRSHGMSELVDHGYDLKSMADELITLLDILDLSVVHLVGYSYGGLVALKAGMFYPERFDKIAIIESPRPDQGDAPEVLRKYGNEFIDQYLENYSETTNLRPGKRQIAKNKKLFEYLFNHTSIKEDFNLDNDLFACLAARPITKEMLLLYGASSDCVDAGNALNQIITSSVLHFGEGDHNLPVQKPEWVASKLTEFMK